MHILQVSNMKISGEIIVLTEPGLLEWKLKDFFSLPAEVNTLYYSPSFHYAGVFWHLGIWPNGRSEAILLTGDKRNTHGFIDIELFKKSDGPPKRLQFSIGLKRLTGEIDFSSSELDFESRVGHGFTGIIKRQNLLTEKHELVPYDVLSISCKIKYCNTTNTSVSESSGVSSLPVSLRARVTVPSIAVSTTTGAFRGYARGRFNSRSRGGMVQRINVLKQQSTRSGTLRECSYCKKHVDSENHTIHEQKCPERPRKCFVCSEVILLKKWIGHVCQPIRTKECSYCKKIVDSGSHSSHEKKCTERPVKCPECSEVISLERWFSHECQPTHKKKCSYCEKMVDIESHSTHEKKCMERSIKCPECSEVVLLEKWYDHECHPPRKTAAEFLCEDFKKMLNEGCDHDIIFKMNDREIKAHKDVLRARSAVFKSMLSHDMLERNSGVINVPDCDPRAMELFLSYIYSGKVEMIEQNTMLGLYYIADKYEVDDLKVECSKFIKQAICPSNFCSIIQLAMNHCDLSLLDFATEYFTNNMLDIFCTIEWQLFLKENSIVANELLIKSHKK